MPQDLTGDGPHRAVGPIGRLPRLDRSPRRVRGALLLASLSIADRASTPPPPAFAPLFSGAGSGRRWHLGGRRHLPPLQPLRRLAGASRTPQLDPPYRSVETRGGPERAPQRAQLPPLKHACGTLFVQAACCGARGAR